MPKVKKLSVTVTYKVGYGDLEMPKEVYDQLVRAEAEGRDICSTGMEGFTEASEWLNQHVRERDCFDHQTSIDEIAK